MPALASARRRPLRGVASARLWSLLRARRARTSDHSSSLKKMVRRYHRHYPANTSWSACDRTRMLPPSREATRCAVRPGPPTIGLASRTRASQAAFSTKACGQAVAWRSVLRVARSRSRPVRRPSSLSAPVSASRRCWQCCMVRLLQAPGRLGRFGGCIQPATGRTIRLPRRRTMCSLRSARRVAA